MFFCVCFMLCSSISLSKAEELENLLCFGRWPQPHSQQTRDTPTLITQHAESASLSLSLSDTALLLRYIASILSGLSSFYSAQLNQLHMCGMILCHIHVISFYNCFSYFSASYPVLSIMNGIKHVIKSKKEISLWDLLHIYNMIVWVVQE